MMQRCFAVSMRFPRSFGCGVGVNILLDTALGPILAVVIVLVLVSRVASKVLDDFARPATGQCENSANSR